MKTVIENLCGNLCNKLRDRGINPTTLIKAIGIFITLIILMPCIFADTTFKFKMTEDGSGIYIDEYK